MKTVLTMMFSFLILNNTSFSKPAEITKEKIKGLQFGFNLIELQESSINKLIHRGIGFQGGWFTEKSERGSLKRLEIQLTTNLLKSSYETEISSFHFRIPVSYSFLYYMGDHLATTDIHVGGFGKVNANFEYFDNWDENHFYWLTAYSLGPEIKFGHTISRRSRLEINVNMPAVSVISRTPERTMNIQSESGFFHIMRKIHEKPRFGLPDRHFEFNFLARHSFRNTGSIKPVLFWKLFYLKNEMPGTAKIKMFSQSFGVEFCF